MQQTLLAKIIKFATVGFSAFILDFSVTYFCKEKLKFNKYFSNTLAFIVAASYNFCLNRMWTFDNHTDAIFSQAVLFFSSMTVGLLIGNTIIYLLNDKLNIDFVAIFKLPFTDNTKINFYIAKLISVGIVMIWNFVMNNFIVFAK